LLRAPSKRKLKSQLKQKRKLFQDSEQEQLIDEMVELIPTVIVEIFFHNILLPPTIFIFRIKLKCRM
jgi:hypothetical protein